jgi:hypothetical protein
MVGNDKVLVDHSQYLDTWVRSGAGWRIGERKLARMVCRWMVLWRRLVGDLLIYFVCRGRLRWTNLVRVLLRVRVEG